jgi:possible bacterial surface protein
MLKFIKQAACLFLLSSPLAAWGETAFEYWFDTNLESRTAGMLTGNTASFEIGMEAFPRGLHSFNYRVLSDGKWGALFTKHFYNSGSTLATAYEYWFDTDYDSKSRGTLAPGAQTFDLDLGSQKRGLHAFNFRVMDGTGEWGAPFTKYYYNSGSTEASVYEYWIDTDYANKTQSAMMSGSQVFDVDIAALPVGYHTFNFRVMDGTGEWGAPFRRHFFNHAGRSFSAYEYWIDNDFEGRTTETATGNTALFEMDLTGIDKSQPHFLNFRAVCGDGAWGSIHRRLILFFKNGGPKVTGYSHSLNGSSLGRVSLPPQDSNEIAVEVDIPDSIAPSLKETALTFDGDNVSASFEGTYLYGFSPETEKGKGIMETWEVPFAENHMAVIEDMGVPSERTFEKPSRLQFHAVRFTSAGGPLYVKASQSACLDIYRDGNKVMALTGEDLLANKEIQLEAGTYVGILYDVPVDEENPDSEVTLRLMDTNNTVPVPEIAYASGMVSMTCRLDGAEIHYTTDGSTPTAESTLYTEPFAVDRNLVVKAIAVLPGSDLADSDVATLAINEFKVANPRIDFVNLEMVITPDQTEGVKTYYTLDGTEPTENSTEYKSPFRVSGNVIVKARSFKEGYTPSDVATYTYTHSVYVAPAPAINYDPAGSTVTLTAKAEGCRLYYSVVRAGEDAGEWTEYTAPVSVAENCRVYGKSTMAGMYDSEVVYIDVNGLKAPAPIIEFKNGTVTISSSLDGSEIYYTLDGSEPTTESAKYADPVAIDRNLTVKAIVVMPDGSLEDSDVATLAINEFKVANPRIDFVNLEMVITPDQTEGVKTYYTLDGTEPTESSTEYTSPFRLTGNTEVRVRSFKEGYNPSDVVSYTYTHATFVTLSPTISVQGTTVTLTARTEGSQIYYGVNNPDVSAMTAYTAPFEIQGNGTIYAFARKSGMYDSEMVSYTVGNLRAETPVLKYNGRYLTIENADADAVVKYNIDSDSDPAADGTVYDGGPIDVGGLVTVKAVAIKEGYGNSETVVLPVKGYGTEAKAMTSEKGQLTACYEWNGGKISGERFTVEGPLNGSDFEWLRAQASVRHLDVSGVANDTLPGNALALPELITVTMPRSLKAVNGKAFGDTGKLCAVELTSDGMAPANLLDGVTNRNLILYMSGAARNESGITNDGITVVDGVSQLAELTEGYPFYCPREFKAESISYTRDFTKVTGIDGDCAGWETIALPFAVESVSHAKGELKPFSVDPETEQLRYWLYAPDAYEWLRADEIQAYRPYLIAMPNNPAYYEPFNVGGTVTFSAKNAAVAATPDNLGFDFKGNRKLCANFMPKEAEAGILPVNDETYEYGGVSYVPGSQFVAGVRAVRPFEAYLQAERSLTRASIFSRSEVEDLMADMDMKVWSEGKVICIRAGFSAKIRVYDTTGQLVRIADVKAGETSRVDDLNAGIYIVGNFKIMIK